MTGALQAQTDFRVHAPGTRPSLPLTTGFERFEAICLGLGPGFSEALPWLAANGAVSPPSSEFRFEVPHEELNASLIFLLSRSRMECEISFGTDQPRAPFFEELTRRYGPRRSDGFFIHEPSGKLVHTQGSATFNGQEHHRLIAIIPDDDDSSTSNEGRGDATDTPGNDNPALLTTEPNS